MAITEAVPEKSELPVELPQHVHHHAYVVRDVRSGSQWTHGP
jgi:hypothetical protein